MIPVLGVPILVRPELLWRMLATIDVTVGEIIVIDNGDCIHEVPDGLPDFTHVWPGFNMGVAASWNHIIKMRPTAPWWAIAAFDIEFAEGDLTRLTEHMETTGGFAMLGDFSAFGFDRETVRQVGFFDENFIPAYYEDNDYDYRCRLAGVPLIGLPAGLRHEMSATIRSTKDRRKRNLYSFPRNGEYFLAKWGGGPYREAFTTPFDGGGDIRSWSLDFDRFADQTWE